MPTPSTSRSNQLRLPEPGTSSTSAPIGEINRRVDQLTLVQSTLQNGATPTLVAGIAMIIEGMQTQAEHSEVVLTVWSRVGLLVRSASLQDSSWHGYDLTHGLVDPRSHQTYGEPTRLCTSEVVPSNHATALCHTTSDARHFAHNPPKTHREIVVFCP